MDSILKFFRAASPWVAMGLLLAIFFARSAGKKRKKQDTSDARITAGIEYGRRGNQ